MRRSLLASLALLVVLAACDDDEVVGAGPGGSGQGGAGASGQGGQGSGGVAGQTAALTAGEIAVTVSAEPFAVKLVRGDATLLEFGLDGFQMGELPAVDPTYNYDPYGLVAKVALYEPPEGLVWRGVERAALGARSATSVTLALEFAGGHTASLVLSVGGDGRVAATWKPTGDTARSGYLRLRPIADATEAFYGLGESFDDVNQRGKLRPLQIELDTTIESSYNEVHVPVPLLIGTRGWGLFVDNHRPAVFDVAKTDARVVDAMFGTGTGSAEGLTFHLLGAARPLDVTRRYYDIAGYPKLPARWALGPWIWRDENKDQAEVEDDIEQLRSRDLATTGLWIDRPYATAVHTFDFDKTRFPDPVAMIEHLHASGLRTALWHTPYLDRAADETAADRAEAKAKGYYPPEMGPPLNKWGDPIDLFNPGAFSWWQGKLGAYKALGIEGYKLDYGEDILPGIGSVRAGWRFADGSTDQTAHITYIRQYHRVYAETLPADGGFLICRHAVAGDQVNGTIVWPGDLDATFDRHREVVTPDDGGKPYTSVGGLPASLIGGLTLGPSGFPFYGADTGGYRHSPPDKELFIRWFEQTALSSVMQVGTSSNTVAWEPTGGPGFDQELLDLYRVYTRLHLRLWPYEWTLAGQLATTGRPLQRPFGLVYPELGEHPNDEYLFGDDLLVAPVVERGLTTRSVVFPAGRWVDWWTGEVITGTGARQDVAAPLGTLPLYLRDNGIVPLLRPTIDTMAPTTKPAEIDSYATTPGVLYARVFVGQKAATTLFDGATLGAEVTAAGLTLTSTPGSEFTHGVQAEVMTFGAAPSKVSDGGAVVAKRASLDALEASASGWFVDTQGSLHVRLGPGAHTVEITR